MIGLQDLLNKRPDSSPTKQKSAQPLISSLQGRDHSDPLPEGPARMGEDIHRFNLEVRELLLEIGQHPADQ
jgi:hypothetical protein